MVNTPPSVELAAPAEAPIASATLAPLPSETPLPTALPPTSAPAGAGMASIPADIPYVQISNVEVDSQDRYAVSFEILNPDKGSYNDRIAFFFNTAPLNASGFPVQDFYTIYTAASPFAILKTAARPKVASQMCALIGKADLSLVADSGNCFPLPDVASVTAQSTTPCLSGPGTGNPLVSELAGGSIVLAYGFSADESWWFVQNPGDPRGTCWVAQEATTSNGDVASLKQVVPTLTPTAGY